MEEKGIALPELSCRSATELPQPDWRRSFGGSPAAVRQLSSGGTIPFSSMSPPPDCRRGLSGSPAEKGMVLPELSCRDAAEFPPPELLVRWSTKS